MMNNNNNHHLGLFLQLPTDITIDILSRLPVESVLTCKHVCKSWHTLINDPVFGHTHTDRLLLQLHLLDAGGGGIGSSGNISFGFLLCTSRKLIVEYYFGEYNIHHHHLGSTFKHKKPPINHESFPSCLYSVASCNGLICLVSNFEDGFNMCVYNPLTREYVNLLPRFTLNIPSLWKCPLPWISRTYVSSYVVTGFGYHPGTKEYKIVRIYYESICSSGQVSVYTLGSDGGWRSKGETSHILYGKGVFVNGALHWLTNRMLVGFKKYIVSFNLVDEEFRIIPSPPPNVLNIHLGVLEGCLSATGTNSYSPQSTSDVWVMTKDKEDQEYTWSQKYNIPWNEPSRPYKPPLAPLFKGDANANANNKILLHYAYMKIVSYDIKRACLDDNVHTMELVNNYDLIPYMKSFASLKALGEDGARIGRISTASSSQKMTAAAENVYMKGNGKQEEEEGGKERLLKKKRMHDDTLAQLEKKKTKVAHHQNRDVSNPVLRTSQDILQNFNAGNGTGSEKVHKCKEKDCGKSFATGSALGGHMSSHRKTKLLGLGLNKSPSGDSSRELRSNTKLPHGDSSRKLRSSSYKLPPGDSSRKFRSSSKSPPGDSSRKLRSCSKSGRSR